MKKLKIGLIGAGNIANAHLEAYRSVPDAEIFAVCDINPERLKETADRFGIERRYPSVDAMLEACPELDAADVCVWNCNHAECTIKALNAGLHVLCEKPMAYNAEEAEKMLAAAKKNDRLLMIGFVLRFSDDARIASDLIRSGALGDIYYSEAQYVRRHGNPGGWFCNKKLSGGGPIIDLGVHVIDLTRYLMGNPNPVSVYAVASDRLGKRPELKTNAGWMPKGASDADPCDVEDFASALIRYDNGAVTHLITSYDFNGEERAKRALYGTKGGLDLSNGVKLYTTTNGFLSDINLHTENYKEHRDMFVAEMGHFVDCALHGTECRAKAEDGVVVMKILGAIYESARTGHEVLIK